MVFTHQSEGKELPFHRCFCFMELILISDAKLKVMLSPEDMRRYDITCDDLDSTEIASRRAFWSILDEARSRTGFDPAGHKIFVQMYPSRSGGCELFVTRLGAKKEGDTKRSRGFVTDTVPAREEQSLYVFSSLSDLLFGCRRLYGEKDPPAARAYVDEKKECFYLVLSADAPVLSEYNGTRCRPREFAYIEEHCRMFCQDAVSLLAPLA